MSPGHRLFALSSLTAGLAGSEGMLVAARLAQGLGAAMTIPAALSILTTTFSEGTDRHTALGAWGAIGWARLRRRRLPRRRALPAGPGWRWVFFVNLPMCALVLVGAFRLLSGDRTAVLA